MRKSMNPQDALKAIDEALQEPEGIIFPPKDPLIKEIYKKSPSEDEYKKRLRCLAEKDNCDAMIALIFCEVFDDTKDASKWYRRIMELRHGKEAADKVKKIVIDVPRAGISMSYPIM